MLYTNVYTLFFIVSSCNDITRAYNFVYESGFLWKCVLIFDACMFVQESDAERDGGKKEKREMIERGD